MDTGLTVANEDEAIAKISRFLSANADYFHDPEIVECYEEEEYIEVVALVEQINNFSPYGGFGNSDG